MSERRVSQIHAFESTIGNPEARCNLAHTPLAAAALLRASPLQQVKTKDRPGRTAMELRASSRTVVRVITAAPLRLYRDALAAALSHHEGVDLAGVVADAAQALRIHALAPVDVIVVDVSCAAGIALAGALATALPTARVLACAVEEGEATILECAAAGAAGYVPADASLEELLAGVQRVARDELVCSPRITASLFRHAGHMPGASAYGGEAQRWRRLTQRESQVLTLLREGRSNKQIAAALAIAEPTVKNHVHHILDKLAVANRTQAVATLSSGASTHRTRRTGA
jgi:two-component system nitrate/nitrite response regulator NarL